MSRDGASVSPSLLEELAGYGTATLHEAAGGVGALPGGIAPLDPTCVVWGRALTVWSPPGDNLALHRAVAVAQPGDVLVVDAKGFMEAGPWGDVLTLQAQKVGIAGLVINCCRRWSSAA